MVCACVRVWCERSWVNYSAERTVMHMVVRGGSVSSLVEIERGVVLLVR